MYPESRENHEYSSDKWLGIYLTMIEMLLTRAWKKVTMEVV